MSTVSFLEIRFSLIYKKNPHRERFSQTLFRYRSQLLIITISLFHYDSHNRNLPINVTRGKNEKKKRKLFLKEKKRKNQGRLNRIEISQRTICARFWTSMMSHDISIFARWFDLIRRQISKFRRKKRYIPILNTKRQFSSSSNLARALVTIYLSPH